MVVNRDHLGALGTGWVARAAQGGRARSAQAGWRAPHKVGGQRASGAGVSARWRIKDGDLAAALRSLGRMIMYLMTVRRVRGAGRLGMAPA